MGVVWEKSRNRWRAEIKIKGKLIYLGRFKTFEEARQVRIAAEIKYGFHPNHDNEPSKGYDL